MSTDVLHIAFTPPGAASLRRALKTDGRRDRVVCLFDDLSFGPIDPPDPDVRKTWVETELGFNGWPVTPEGFLPYTQTEFDVSWDELGATTRKFWSKALTEKFRKVVWITRRSAKEYAGFLEWLWQAGDAPCEIVDLTECKVLHYRADEAPTPALAVSLDRLWSETILRNKLLDRAAPLLASHRTRYLALWRRLRMENAPLRIASAEGLRSAPITYYDENLLSYTVSNWRKVARIVGDVLGAQYDNDLRQCGEVVLAARINALVKSGGLKFEGRPFAMRFSEIRLPQPSALDG